MSISDLITSSDKPYKVKLIAALNPHVFWIEPILDRVDGSNELHIVQAGLANVFPSDIKCVDPIYMTQRFSSLNWIPAGKRLLQKAVTSTGEAYFLPLYVMPDEFSIINETKCVFGDLFAIIDNGLVSITKMLMDNGVLYRSTKRFQKYLDSEVIFIDRSAPELDNIVESVLDYANNKQTSLMESNMSPQDPTGVRKLVDRCRLELEEELSKDGDVTKANKVLRDMNGVYNQCIRLAEEEKFNGVKIIKDKSNCSVKPERITSRLSDANYLNISKTVTSPETDVDKKTTKLLYIPAGANISQYHQGENDKSPDSVKKKQIEKYLEGVHRNQNKHLKCENHNSSFSNNSCDSKSASSFENSSISSNLSGINFSEIDNSVLSHKENIQNSVKNSNIKVKERSDYKTSAHKLNFLRNCTYEKSPDLRCISRNTSDYQGSSEETDSSISTICSNNDLKHNSLKMKQMKRFVDEQSCQYSSSEDSYSKKKTPLNNETSSKNNPLTSSKNKFLKQHGDISSTAFVVDSETNSVVSTPSASFKIKQSFFANELNKTNSEKVSKTESSDKTAMICYDDNDSNSVVSTSHQAKCKFLGINSDREVKDSQCSSHHGKWKFFSKNGINCDIKAVATKSDSQRDVTTKPDSEGDVDSVVSVASTSLQTKCKFLKLNTANCETKAVKTKPYSEEDIDSVVSVASASLQTKCKFLKLNTANCEKKAVTIKSDSEGDIDSVVSVASTSYQTKCKFLKLNAANCEMKAVSSKPDAERDTDSVVYAAFTSHQKKCKFLKLNTANCETKAITTKPDSVVSRASTSHQIKCELLKLNTANCVTKDITTKSDSEGDIHSVDSATSTSHQTKCKFLKLNTASCETKAVTNKSDAKGDIDSVVSAASSSHQTKCKFLKLNTASCETKAVITKSESERVVATVVPAASSSHQTKCEFLKSNTANGETKAAATKSDSEKDIDSVVSASSKSHQTKCKFLKSNTVNGEIKAVKTKSDSERNIDSVVSAASTPQRTKRKISGTLRSTDSLSPKSKLNSSTEDDVFNVSLPESFSSPISCSSLNLNLNQSKKSPPFKTSNVKENNSKLDSECDPALIEEDCTESSNSSSFGTNWNISKPLTFGVDTLGIKAPFYLHQSSIPLTTFKDKENAQDESLVMFNDYAQYSYFDDLIEKVVTPKMVVHSESGETSRPIKDLESTHFLPAIINNLGSLNVKMPTKLQSSVWPVAFRDRSTFVIGSINSGRSLSVLAPICNKLPKIMPSNLPDGIGPFVTIVCPDVFSANTVYSICRILLKDCTMVTGESFKIIKIDDRNDSNNLYTIMNGVDVLIATSHCMYDILNADMSIINFYKLQYVFFEDLDILNEQFYFETKRIIQEFQKIDTKNVKKNSQQIRMYATSQIWCEFLEQLALKSYNPTLVVSSLQECLFYSKPQLNVTMIKDCNKLKRLENIFQNSTPAFRRIVIVCKNDEEIASVQTLLEESHIMCIAGPSLTIDLLNDVRKTWRCHNLSSSSIVMLTCDENLQFLDINNAHWLIHYSLPKTYSRFNLRFSTMSSNFPNLYKSSNEKTLQLKVDVFITEEDLIRLPKLSQFIKRFGIEIPPNLNCLIEKFVKQQDVVKAITFVPLCERLSAFGYCSDMWSCIERHSLVKQDYPSKWLPRSGRVKCRVTSVQHTSLYSARLLEYTDFKGKRHIIPQKHISLLLDLQSYFSPEGNRRHHKSAKCGDICAVEINDNYKRCQVLRIIPTSERKELDIIRVILLDEQCYADMKRCDLLYLPEYFKLQQTTIVKIRLAGVLPNDDNDFWSTTAIKSVKTLFSSDKDLVIQGNIVLSIGNTLWLDDIKISKHLDNLGIDIVKCNLKSNLICNGLAITNNSHMQVLYNLCEEFNFQLPSLVRPSKRIVRNVSFKPQWAHLNEDFTDVYFSHAETLGFFFIRHVAYNKCLENLEKDLLLHVDETRKKFINADAEITEESVKQGYYCIALFSDDNSYYRAKVLNIVESTDNYKICKCFFVDHGETRTVRSNDIYPITEELVRQLPFQVIECRFYGIKPMLEEWDDTATDKLYDFSFVDLSDDLKILVAKYYTKEKAECTGGNKYGIILVDCIAQMSFTDFIIKEQLALPVTDEIENIVNDEISSLFQLTEPYVSDDDEHMQSTDLNLVEWSDEDEEESKWDCQFYKEDYENLLKRDHLPRICGNTFDNKKEQDVETTKDVDVRKIIPLVHDSKKTFKTPRILWHQTDEHVTIKIMLADVNVYECLLKTKTLYFETSVDYVRYKLDIELFACIKENKSQHTTKGMYVFIRLYKHSRLPWDSLTASHSIVNNKLIVYDPDFVFVEDEVDSDGEEQRMRENLQKNIVSADDDHLDSDDDECNDDFSDVQLLSATDHMISKEIMKKITNQTPGSSEDNDEEYDTE